MKASGKSVGYSSKKIPLSISAGFIKAAQHLMQGRSRTT